MPKQKTKYNSYWENVIYENGDKFSEWLTNFDESTAYCKVCNIKFSIAYLGKKAVIKHCLSITHSNEVHLNSDDIELPSFTDDQHQNQVNDTLDEKICKAETLWCIATAEHNISFATNDHLTKLFPKMFPDDPVASGFKCGKTKSTYITKHGIAVTNLENLQEKLKDKVFSLMIDESNKNYGEKFFL